MLPKRGSISSYAHGVLGDGDDLHITGSFEENEENSSTIANASCINHPRASHPEERSVGTERKNSGNSKSDNLQDEEQMEAVRFSKKPLKVMNKIFRQLRQKHRQHLLKFRQQPAVFRSSISTINEYQEMVEDENENDHQHAEESTTRTDDSMTIVSQRSTRNNIRTGRSMLVRHKAEVFNRPSAAQAKWDISSSFSSDSTSYRNILRRQRSLTLDNSSCDGLSVLTDDTSLYRSFSKMDHLSFRQRRPMFIDATTYCIEEDIDESESSVDSEGEGNDVSPDSDVIECGYDFRQLPSFDENNNTELTPGNDFNSDWHLGNEEVEEVTQTPFDIRQRVFSDSDVIFERQRHVANGYSGIDLPSSSTKSSFSANQETFQKIVKSHRRSSSSPTSNTESFDTSFEAFNTHHGSVYLPHLDLYDDTWIESKRRTYSDSCIQRTLVNQTFESPLWGDMNDKKKSLVQNDSLLDGEFGQSICKPKRSNNRLSLEAGDWSSQPQHTLGFDEQSSFSNSTITMTYSDSTVNEKSLFETPSRYPRNQSLLDFDNQEDSEGLFGTSEFGSSPMASHARRLTTTLLSNKRRSSPTKEVVEYTTLTIGYPATSSVLATLSPTNHATSGILSADKNRVMPMKYSSIRQSSSPRTLNAASMIVTALRPAPAHTQAMLPSPSPVSGNKRSDNYYWNQDPGTVEMCEVQQQQAGIIRAWSSESFDDVPF
jgi:hypothetical protein